MIFQYFFGPDKIPFLFAENGQIESRPILPFHGIISRGLMNLSNRKRLESSAWKTYAHLLDFKDRAKDPDELKILRQMAKQCGVLTFAQSGLCVKIYIESDSLKTGDNNIYCDVWNIKEGHTSSVWKVTIRAKETVETFVVNVARDREAGIELKESSAKLKTIGEKIPSVNMAKVYDIRVIHHTNLPGEVVVTRNEWIGNSFEIHSRTNKQTGKGQLLIVERFLTNENNPTHITSVLGRLITIEDVKKIEKGIDDFLNHAATCLQNKPEININDGDLVWNGEKAIVVAIS